MKEMRAIRPLIAVLLMPDSEQLSGLSNTFNAPLKYKKRCWTPTKNWYLVIKRQPLSWKIWGTKRRRRGKWNEQASVPKD